MFRTIPGYSPWDDFSPLRGKNSQGSRILIIDSKGTVCTKPADLLPPAKDTAPRSVCVRSPLIRYHLCPPPFRSTLLHHPGRKQVRVSLLPMSHYLTQLETLPVSDRIELLLAVYLPQSRPLLVPRQLIGLYILSCTSGLDHRDVYSAQAL